LNYSDINYSHLNPLNTETRNKIVKQIENRSIQSGSSTNV